jgi:hypothetical protein
MSCDANANSWSVNGMRFNVGHGVNASPTTLKSVSCV